MERREGESRKWKVAGRSLYGILTHDSGLLDESYHPKNRKPWRRDIAGMFCFETISRKIKGLSVESQGPAKIYLVEIKRFMFAVGAEACKKNILKTKVGYWKLLKTNVDKLSGFRAETMLLKTK
ncbi:MAG: hypothetical protein ABSF45_16555 [Terriglobia bacterium]|jgi:hypothetical protein